MGPSTLSNARPGDHPELDHVELTPAALRAELEGPRTTPRYLYSSVELIDHAADLLSDSAGLVHDNERRWRLFHRRVADLIADAVTEPERS